MICRNNTRTNSVIQIIRSTVDHISTCKNFLFVSFFLAFFFWFQQFIFLWFLLLLIDFVHRKSKLCEKKKIEKKRNENKLKALRVKLRKKFARRIVQNGQEWVKEKKRKSELCVCQRSAVKMRIKQSAFASSFLIKFSRGSFETIWNEFWARFFLLFFCSTHRTELIQWRRLIMNKLIE